MKAAITLNSGEVVEIDGITALDAATLIDQLCGNSAPSVTKKRGRPPGRRDEKTGLTPTQMETWQWLCDNDSSSGASLQEIAHGMGISVAAVASRMQELKTRSMAHRAHHGWRPGEAPAEGVSSADNQ